MQIPTTVETHEFKPQVGHSAIDYPKVTIITVGYNHLNDLQRCLPSLYDQTYPNFEIVVVDNDSRDGSADYVEVEHPHVHLIRAGENLGFSGANNLGASEACGEFLVFLNPDTRVEPDWLTALLKAFDDPTVGLATSKILLMEQPDRINTCGNDVHFTGYAYLKGWLEPADTFDEPMPVFSVSGCAFMMRKSLFEALGGFDESFNPVYVEDTDLSWRTRLAGYQCVFVPASVIYHDYTPGISASKYYCLERNRYQMLIKNYHLRTLALLLPAIMIGEVVAWGYATMRGLPYLQSKFKSYGWLVRHLDRILSARKRVQALRRVPDREIMLACQHGLAYEQARDGLVSTIARLLFDPVFYVTWRVCTTVMNW